VCVIIREMFINKKKRTIGYMVRAKARAGPSVGSRGQLCPIEAKTIYFVNQVLIFLRFTALNLINKTIWSHKRTTKYGVVYE